MPKVWSIIKGLAGDQTGSSLVEVLLAAVVFGVLAVGLVGALIYGRQSTDEAGTRARAVMLAEEGTEAVRNIRDAAFTNLVDGTYGLIQSGNQWTLSGASDTTGLFTRSVTVAAAGTNRKAITSNVSWSRHGGTSSTSIITRLSNWVATIAPTSNWALPVQQSTLDISGTSTDSAVTTAGNYAYIARIVAPTLAIVNISNPAAPVLSGSAAVTGTTTDIFVSGNYAYITTTDDTGELRIYNISNPAAPVLAGTYDAPGAADGQAVYVIGTTVHLVRSANAANYEYVRINASNPAAPVAVANYNLNIKMYDVYADATTVYIASASDTQEIIRLSATTTGSLTIGGSTDLTGTVDATTISGMGAVYGVIQGAALRVVNASNVVVGNLTLAGTSYDISYDSAHNLLFAATIGGSAEVQVVNPANPAAPVVFGTLNLTGTLQTYALAYSLTMDRLVIITNSATTELNIARPS